jgi:hypothetical protein
LLSAPSGELLGGGGGAMAAATAPSMGSSRALIDDELARAGVPLI